MESAAGRRATARPRTLRLLQMLHYHSDTFARIPFGNLQEVGETAVVVTCSTLNCRLGALLVSGRRGEPDFLAGKGVGADPRSVWTAANVLLRNLWEELDAPAVLRPAELEPALEDAAGRLGVGDVLLAAPLRAVRAGHLDERVGLLIAARPRTESDLEADLMALDLIGSLTTGGIASAISRLHLLETKRALEQEVEERRTADKAKTNFLAVMSHELRTPLNAIIGYADLLLLGIGASVPAKGRQQIERIVASARHLLQMIEEILTYSRTETGEEQVRPRVVPLAEVGRQAAELVRPAAAEKNLSFNVRLPDDGAAAWTDPRKVCQILVDLLSNAVKFTESGTIELEASADRGTAVFRVRDTGVGIAPENVERIFEPFWQVDQGTTRTAEGTGLGLTVARRLARLLGGDVSVESTPGAGSTFTVRLPADPPAAEHTDNSESR